MSTSVYQFSTKAFILNPKIDLKRNLAYQTLMQSNAQWQGSITNPAGQIAGVRTSATRFTRTAGTHTTADLNKYVLSYATATPTNFGWHRLVTIASDGSYCDFDASGTSGGLPVGIDAIILLDTDEVTALATAETMLTLQARATETLIIHPEDLAQAPQAYGSSTTGANTYATVITANANRTHLLVNNAGAKACIISVDGGTTDHLYIPGGGIAIFDNLLIANGATVKAKNGVAGENYTDLKITLW